MHPFVLRLPEIGSLRPSFTAAHPPSVRRFSGLPDSARCLRASIRGCDTRCSRTASRLGQHFSAHHCIPVSVVSGCPKKDRLPVWKRRGIEFGGIAATSPVCNRTFQLGHSRAVGRTQVEEIQPRLKLFMQFLVFDAEKPPDGRRTFTWPRAAGQT